MKLFLSFFICILFTESLMAKLIPTQQFLQARSGVIFDGDTAGGESIGGGDSVDVRKQTAWFYGDKAIEVCYHRSVTFGPTSSQIKTDLNQVVSHWKEYFSRKRIGSHLSADKRINTNFQIKPKCEGGEDLVLYFGVGPIFGNLGDLQARQALSRPVAYVNKTHMSEDFTWSKGYIRFVEPFLYTFSAKNYFPNWGKNAAFYNLLLHEWGHVMGFAHTSDTIMKKEVAKNNLIDEATSEVKEKIDQGEELYSCIGCVKKYPVRKTKIKNLRSIKIDSKDKIFIQTGRSFIPVQMDYAKFEKKQLSLLSLFSMNSYRYKQPSIYFVKYRKKSYTLEFISKKIIMRRGSRIVAEFEKGEF